MVRFLLQAALILAVVIAAWRNGGKPERYVATTYLVMLIASTANAMMTDGYSDTDYSGLHNVRFLLDCAALVSVVFVALRYNRWWTLWVGSVQFIAVMAHLLRALALPMPPLAYAVLERWPVWMAILITGGGVILYHRRSKIQPFID